MSSDRGIPSGGKNRLRKYAFISLILVLLVAAGSMLHSGREPTYQGKTLRKWLRGHPKEYVPVVQAMGTNAIPYLLSELQSSDSSLSKLGQEAFRRFLDSAAPWETSSSRRYHARIGLQILGTNAVPALLKALFQEPFQLKESHITWETAHAFNFLGVAEAHQQIGKALSEAMQNPDMQKRRTACLAFYSGFEGNAAQTHRLVELTNDPEPLVRAAATRALIMWQKNEVEVIPALIARLDDEQAAIRRLAIEALGGRKTNAIGALPALLAAYPNELTRTSLRDEVDDVFRGDRVLAPQQNQRAILYALKTISPGTPLPGPNP